MHEYMHNRGAACGALAGDLVSKNQNKPQPPKLPLLNRSACQSNFNYSIRLQAHTWIGKYYRVFAQELGRICV